MRELADEEGEAAGGGSAVPARMARGVVRGVAAQGLPLCVHGSFYLLLEMARR